VVVNHALPTGGAVVSGLPARRQRVPQALLLGDLNGNGVVNSVDFKRFWLRGKPRSAKCNLADMNSDAGSTWPATTRFGWRGSRQGLRPW